VKPGTDTRQNQGGAMCNMPGCTDCVCNALHNGAERRGHEGSQGPQTGGLRLYTSCASVKDPRICLTSVYRVPDHRHFVFVCVSLCVCVFEDMCSFRCLNCSTHQLLFHV